MPELVHIPREELETLSRAALGQVGVPPADAATAAGILVMADLQGIDTHGTRRLPAYVARLRDGAFNPTPDIRVTRHATSAAIVDGDRGLGQVVASRGLKEALDIAGEHGIGYVGCRDSQHLGPLAPYAHRAAAAGMVCILGTNALASMAPPGGRDITVGNNPFGLAAPRRDAPPFILDVAMSVAARGKMRTATQRGEAIPPGWALDAEGRPTTDPSEGLKGYVLPIGGHKGYGLALAVDILAGVLSGGAVATELQSLLKPPPVPQRVGHFFIAIDPARLLGMDAYYERIETLCSLMTGSRPFDDDTPVMIPGEPEARSLARRNAEGIPLEPDFLDTLKGLAHGEPPRDVATV